jgi:hypothetical protein
MKYLILLIFFPFLLSGQTFKQKMNRYAKAAPGYYMAGMADGLNQTLLFHYPKFKKVHPRASDQFWNPAQSWKNKNNRGFIMKTSLVGMTDGHHMSRTLNRSFLRFNSMVVPQISIPKQDWYWYPVDFIFLFAVESAGFHTTYSLIYK